MASCGVYVQVKWDDVEEMIIEAKEALFVPSIFFIRIINIK